MSLSSNFPTIRPSLLLDFANVGRLDPRVTFTRATTATYYDGVTTAVAEQNLLTYSQEFENPAWVNLNTTETANSTTAPDGTSTADTLDDGLATAGHDIGQNFSGVSGTTYTLSAFFKDVNRQYVILACSASPSAWASAKFDLTAGTAGSTSASGAGWSTTSSSITSVGNSWYRCTITFVSGSTATLAARIGMATDSTTFTAGERGLQSYTGTNATIYIWGAQLEQRSSVTAYTATTTQAITNYIPVLLTAQNNVSRFDHNPTTGAALGLLIEEQRTNSFTYSEDFADAAWTKDECSVTANAIVAPDGTLTGDIVIANTAALQHQVRQTITLAASTTYTISVYAKAGGENLIGIGVGGNVKPITTNFDLSTLTFSGDVSVGGTIVSKSFTQIGNGWNRISLVFTTDSSGTVPNIARISPRGFALTPGDGYSGIFIWGAQLEAGAFATSYIPTTTTALTRNADVASMTGTNFSSWYNQSEGTVFVSAQYPNPVVTGKTHELINLFQTSVGNLYDIRAFSTTVRFAVQNTNTAVGTGLINAPNKVAFGYTGSGSVSQSGSLNGAAAVAATTAITRTADALSLGGGGGSNTLNGHIQRISFWPTRLPNATLQALTA